MFNYDVLLSTCANLPSNEFTNKTTHKEPLLFYNIEALGVHYLTKSMYIFVDGRFFHTYSCRKEKKENVTVAPTVKTITANSIAN